MRKTSQWRAERQRQRTNRHEAKRRAKHNAWRPRTTGYKRPDVLSLHMTQRIRRGDLLKLLGFAPDGYDAQPVGTRIRQKKAA